MRPVNKFRQVINNHSGIDASKAKAIALHDISECEEKNYCAIEYLVKRYLRITNVYFIDEL